MELLVKTVQDVKILKCVQGKIGQVSKYLRDSLRETRETDSISLRKFSDLKIAGSWEKTLRKNYMCLPCS